jgi:hypothetical protein
LVGDIDGFWREVLSADEEGLPVDREVGRRGCAVGGEAHAAHALRIACVLAVCRRWMEAMEGMEGHRRPAWLLSMGAARRMA